MFCDEKPSKCLALGRILAILVCLELEDIPQSLAHPVALLHNCSKQSNHRLFLLSQPIDYILCSIKTACTINFFVYSKPKNYTISKDKNCHYSIYLLNFLVVVNFLPSIVQNLKHSLPGNDHVSLRY